MLEISISTPSDFGKLREGASQVLSTQVVWSPENFHGHTVASPHRWPWLSTSTKNVLARHPYCTLCGLVKTTGATKALDAGDVANVIARFERELAQVELRMTEIQKRLLMRKIQSHHLDDSFGLRRDAQIRLLSEAIGTTLHMPASVAESYLRSC